MESWCTEKEITKRNKMNSRNYMNYLSLKQLQRDLGSMWKKEKKHFFSTMIPSLSSRKTPLRSAIHSIIKKSKWNEKISYFLFCNACWLFKTESLFSSNICSDIAILLLISDIHHIHTHTHTHNTFNKYFKFIFSLVSHLFL